MSEMIFSNYTAGATVVARYVTPKVIVMEALGLMLMGAIKAMIDGISDASVNRVYIILIASGTYKPSDSYVMKNHITLVGDFMDRSYDRIGESHLAGNGNKGAFNNDNNGLDKTSLLYGVVIANGDSGGNGGGMYNYYSSPFLVNVTFPGNAANK